MSYIQEVLMTVLPYLSQIVALFHMLPPKFANIQYGSQTGLESNALKLLLDYPTNQWRYTFHLIGFKAGG